MDSIIPLAVLAYVAYEVNRRSKQDDPIEKAVDDAVVEAPTPTSSNPIVSQQGDPRRWRKPKENHKEVFGRLMSIRPQSPLDDLADQRNQIEKDQKEHEAKTLDKLILD